MLFWVYENHTFQLPEGGLMSSRKISALRVKDTLEERPAPELGSKYTLLQRKKSYMYSFYVVRSTWKRELRECKKVSVVAEIRLSKTSSNYAVKIWDDSVVSDQGLFDAVPNTYHSLKATEQTYCALA